jgi:hypothetical protein
MFFVRKALVHITYRPLRIGQLLLCVLERRQSRVEVALPLGDLFGELAIRARQRGELELERFDAACGRRELLT